MTAARPGFITSPAPTVRRRACSRSACPTMSGSRWALPWLTTTCTARAWWRATAPARCTPRPLWSRRFPLTRTIPRIPPTRRIPTPRTVPTRAGRPIRMIPCPRIFPRTMRNSRIPSSVRTARQGGRRPAPKGAAGLPFSCLSAGKNIRMQQKQQKQQAQNTKNRLLLYNSLKFSAF